MNFTGHVLLPALAGDEVGDDIPQRKLTVAKADGTVVLEETFDASSTERTFSGVAFGEALTLSLWDIDEAGNLSAAPSVLTTSVTDTSPPATPGAMSVSFTQDAPAAAP